MGASQVTLYTCDLCRKEIEQRAPPYNQESPLWVMQVQSAGHANRHGGGGRHYVKRGEAIEVRGQDAEVVHASVCEGCARAIVGLFGVDLRNREHEETKRRATSALVVEARSAVEIKNDMGELSKWLRTEKPKPTDALAKLRAFVAKWDASDASTPLRNVDPFKIGGGE